MVSVLNRLPLATHAYTTAAGTAGKATPVGFEPTRGDPIGLAGRRLNRSAKVSLTRRTYTQLFADDAYSLPHSHNSMQDSNVTTSTCFMLLLAWAIYCACSCL